LCCKKKITSYEIDGGWKYCRNCREYIKKHNKNIDRKYNAIYSKYWRLKKKLEKIKTEHNLEQ